MNLLCWNGQFLALEEQVDAHNKLIEKISNLPGLEVKIGRLIHQVVVFLLCLQDELLIKGGVQFLYGLDS